MEGIKLQACPGLCWCMRVGTTINQSGFCGKLVFTTSQTGRGAISEVGGGKFNAMGRMVHRIVNHGHLPPKVKVVFRVIGDLTHYFRGLLPGMRCRFIDIKISNTTEVWDEWSTKQIVYAAGTRAWVTSMLNGAPAIPDDGVELSEEFEAVQSVSENRRNFSVRFI